jgi:hypothetical protein
MSPLRDWSRKLAADIRNVWEAARASLLQMRFDPTREQPHAIDAATLESAVLCERTRILYETPGYC